MAESAGRHMKELIQDTQTLLMNQLKMMNLMQQQELVLEQQKLIEQQMKQMERYSKMTSAYAADTQNDQQEPLLGRDDAVKEEKENGHHMDTMMTGDIILQVLEWAKAYDEDSAADLDLIAEEGSEVAAKLSYRPREFLEFVDSVLSRMVEVGWVLRGPDGCYYLNPLKRRKVDIRPARHSAEERAPKAGPVKAEREARRVPREAKAVKAEKRALETKPERNEETAKGANEMSGEEDRALIKDGLWLCAIHELSNRNKCRAGFREDEIRGETERIKDALRGLCLDGGKGLGCYLVNGYVKGTNGEYSLSPKGKRHAERVLKKCKLYQKPTSLFSSSSSPSAEPAKKRRRC